MKNKTRGLTRWLGNKRAERVPDLGPREMAALEHLWAAGSLSAQELLELMDSAVLTLSTIQSTLERLHRKRMVRRSKQGRAYVYAATLTRRELIGRLLRDLADDVGGGELAPMISGFAEFVAADDPDIERKLTRLLDGGEGRHD